MTLNDPSSRVLPNQKDSDSAGNSGADSGLDFRDYRAPQSHGECLAEPGFGSVAALLKTNRELQQGQSFPGAALRENARRKLIEDAVRYTSSYRSVGTIGRVDGDQPLPPILMAGHQPALFHAGVWFKNFALSRIATQQRAVAINLVIDNDVASGCSIRVPVVQSDQRVSYQTVAFDDAGGGVPYEQTTIQNRDVFDSFDQRVKESISPLVADPCVTAMWQHAKAAVQRCGIAGCALAQARHGLEGDLGLETLEIPLGVVCRTTEFAEFALAILTELPRFHRCYNDATNLYRVIHGIRSSAHPVPNLAEDGEWFEAPMWVYGDDAPLRRPVWAKLSDDHLVLSDRVEREHRIDLRYPKLAAEQLASLASPNFKLRPRALLTTMYARLVLSDLFLHGIGGGKYDQLNDRIIRSFFMLEPPQFMVASATVQLPGVVGDDHRPQIRDLKRRIRDTVFQAERFVDEIELSPADVERKQQLLQHVPPVGKRWKWHAEVTQLNESLSRQTRPLRTRLREELARVERNAMANGLLASREHPFCLFPLDYLKATYDSMLSSIT